MAENSVLKDRDKQIKRLRKGLERIASSEAIYIAGMIQPESKARMLLAERILHTNHDPEAIAAGISEELSRQTKIELNNKAKEKKK